MGGNYLLASHDTGLGERWEGADGGWGIEERERQKIVSILLVVNVEEGEQVCCSGAAGEEVQDKGVERKPTAGEGRSDVGWRLDML